jgi:hypothetical protein
MPDAISRGCSMWRAMILVIVSISWHLALSDRARPDLGHDLDNLNRASGFKPWRRRASVMAAPIVGGGGARAPAREAGCAGREAPDVEGGGVGHGSSGDGSITVTRSAAR